MLSAYLKFEGPGKERIERFRREHDSLFEKVEAHITVLFPNNELPEDKIVSSIQALRNLTRNRFKLSTEITYDGGVGYLKLVKGNTFPSDIYSSLSVSLGVSGKFKYAPHVTVVRDSIEKPSELNLGNSDFVITGIVLEKILENGVGQIVYHQKI